MPMSYTSLVAPKGTTGSILNWVGYSKLDIGTIVDEAQYLLFQILRVREMRTEYTFRVGVSQSMAPLPTRFLDPIGDIFDLTNSAYYKHEIETPILRKRAYDSSFAGTLGTNPFTTTLNSGLVSVALANHGFTQGSDFTADNAPTLNGLALAGTFPVTSVTDANTFVINAGDATDTVASASGSGGGSGITYSADVLASGSPSCWGIWNEQFQFDLAMDTAWTGKLLYYRRPQLLSSTNLTNFLTDRYPVLMRVACMAAAAKYMKDDGEYQKLISELNNLVQTTATFDDLSYRGASFGTETP